MIVFLLHCLQTNNIDAQLFNWWTWFSISITNHFWQIQIFLSKSGLLSFGFHMFIFCSISRCRQSNFQFDASRFVEIRNLETKKLTKLGLYFPSTVFGLFFSPLWMVGRWLGVNSRWLYAIGECWKVGSNLGPYGGGVFECIGTWRGSNPNGDPTIRDLDECIGTLTSVFGAAYLGPPMGLNLGPCECVRFRTQ